MPKPGPVRGPDTPVRFEPKARHPVSGWLTGCRCRPEDRDGLELFRDFDGCRGREAFVDPDVEGSVAGEAADEDAQHEEGHGQHPRRLLKEVGGALDAADLAGSLESGGESSPLGVLDQNHCTQEEADNQDDDGKESGHVQLFKSFAAF